MKISIAQIRQIAEEEAKKLDLKICSVNWVNEYQTLILRIIADSKEGLTIEQSTNLNQAISDKLDELDMIEEEYMLEVSSPGLERELENDEDILKSIDQYIYLETKEHIALTPKSKIKELYGYLRGYANNILEIEYNNKGQLKKLKIEKQNIKFIRLAIKF